MAALLWFRYIPQVYYDPILWIVCGSSLIQILFKFFRAMFYTTIGFRDEEISYLWELSSHQFSSVQSLSRVQIFATPWIAAHQASFHHQLPEFTQTHVHRVGNAIQPSHPLSSPYLPAPSPPSIRVFSNESTLCMRWPKYWSFSFSISPSNEHPGLISFRMDWLDLFAVQGTPKSLLQYHSSKASILWCSAFFTVQLSHPYMCKNHSLD